MIVCLFFLFHLQLFFLSEMTWQLLPLAHHLVFPGMIFLNNYTGNHVENGFMRWQERPQREQPQDISVARARYGSDLGQVCVLVIEQR